MAPRKHVPTLVRISGDAVKQTLMFLAQHFFSKKISFREFVRLFEIFEIELSTFGQIYTEISSLIIEAADRLPYLPRDTSVIIDIFIRKATQFYIKEFNFNEHTVLVSDCFRDRIWKASTLERLYEFSFVPSITYHHLPYLRNLTHLSVRKCSDKNLAVICENCDLLEEISVMKSPELTNRIIDSLALLKKLRVLKLPWAESSITEEGFANLLVNSRSDRLAEIYIWSGFLEENLSFTNFMKQVTIKTVPFRTFHLSRFVCPRLEPKALNFIRKYFPSLECLKLLCKSSGLKNLSLVGSMNNLRSLSLEVFDTITRDDYETAQPESLLSLEIPTLTELIIWGWDQEFSVQRLLEFCQKCPNIERLELKARLNFPSQPRGPAACLSGNPFPNLRHLIFEAEPFYAAENIIDHAHNIETLAIGNCLFSKPVSIVSDEFIDRIFQVNPLSNLRKFSSMHWNVSVEKFKSIVRRCENLISIQFPQSADCSQLEIFISENNYNVKIIKEDVENY